MPPEQDKHSKTERPTSRKLQKSREQGQVAKSQDLSGTVALIFGFIMFLILVPYISQSFYKIFSTTALDFNFDQVSAKGFNMIMMNLFKEFLIIVVPYCLVVWVSAFVATSFQVGFHFSTKPLEPSFEKIDPVKGFQRLVSLRGLVNAGLSILKMIIVACIAGSVFMKPQTLQMIHLNDIQGTLYVGTGVVTELVMKACLALLVIGFIDYAYQKWQFLEDQKMTKDEVKREHKDQEGNPEIKSKVKSIQRASAQKRGLKETVKDADVVIVNPFHIAVAIKYDRENGQTAPIVVAKGARLLAQRIKEFARDAGVEIIQNIPLARALYKDVKAGLEIPAELYVAVAEVLAVVFRKKDSRRIAR